jgi:hypothetical protein
VLKSDLPSALRHAYYADRKEAHALGARAVEGALRHGLVELVRQARGKVLNLHLYHVPFLDMRIQGADAKRLLEPLPDGSLMRPRPAVQPERIVRPPICPFVGERFGGNLDGDPVFNGWFSFGQSLAVLDPSEQVSERPSTQTAHLEGVISDTRFVRRLL